jgi:hypothetical protein
MANTIIQFKRSSVTAAPASLSYGEPAVSFSANKVYIGNTTGHVHTIGGSYYTSIIDGATDANTFSALVKRDSGGSFEATWIKAALFGNANTATKWETDRWVNVTGDVDSIAVRANGTANIDLTLELTNSGVTACTYGGGSTVPVFTVDEDGRITAAFNVASAASGSFNVAGDTGSFVLSSSETLTVVGGDGVTTTSTDTGPGINLTVDVDSTVVRTTGDQTIAGTKTFSGPGVIINGNLTVSGVTTYANTQQLNIGDNIIQLNTDLPGATAPSENAGININRGSSANVEFRWNETSDFWELTEDGTNYKRIFHDAYANASSHTTGTLPSARLSGSYTGITGLGTVTVGTWSADTIAVNKGGTNITSYAVGDLLYADGTSSLAKLADVATGNVLISGGVTTAPAWGKANLITHITGTLGVGNGGTGAATWTTNGILYGQLTSPLGVTAAGTEGQVLQANFTGVPVFGGIDCGTF